MSKRFNLAKFDNVDLTPIEEAKNKFETIKKELV